MSFSGRKLMYNLGKSEGSKGHFGKAGGETGNEKQNTF